MRQFIQGVPDELIDAARIDGAGEARILVRIVAPLVTPALAALALFAFVYYWNAYLWPLTVLSGQEAGIRSCSASAVCSATRARRRTPTW